MKLRDTGEYSKIFHEKCTKNLIKNILARLFRNHSDNRNNHLANLIPSRCYFY